MDMLHTSTDLLTLLKRNKSPRKYFKNGGTKTDIYFNVYFQDHIQEVLDKWESIDDEIWAKVIVLERNRRVAKAYARAPVLTINGSTDGFDGFRY